MKRVIAVLFVVAVIAGSWFLYGRNRQVEPELPEGIKTAKVERGAIESTVSATGSVTAERVSGVTFNTTGRVVEVLVQEGDTIAAGEVMARLDTRDLELSLQQAEAQLQVSQASLARARKAPSEDEIAAAQAAIESAKANLENLQKGPSSRDKELAKLSIDQAKNSLWGAQGNRDAVKGSPISGGGTKAQAEAQVANAELAVKVAEINYQKLFEPLPASQIKAAEAQIVQAESNLARLLSTPSAEDIAVAEAQVAQARVGVESARKRLDDAILTAPSSGRLTTWNLHVGDTVVPGTPVGTLVDNSRYHIDVNIDETEIVRIQEGQSVNIELDAFPDQTIGGKVTTIDLVGVSAQGIVNYGVRIDLEPTELAIKPLMTAAIKVVVDQKENVLLVSNRALKRDIQGRYVEILRSNVPIKVYVITGVSSQDVTEIREGLQEGQEVIVERPRVNVLGGPFGG